MPRLEGVVFFFGTAIYQPRARNNLSNEGIIYYISLTKSILLCNFMRLTMKKILITLSLIALSACQTIDSRGQFIDDNQVSKLQNKNLTKNEVISLIGSPTMTPDYSSDTWYYASMAIARKTWTMPKVKSERLVKITFAGDRVSSVEVQDEKLRGNDIKVVKDYTKSKGTEQNSLQRFVKNFGRFNKSSKKKKHR